MSIKKRIVWVFVSCLMVLSLVIASCGQKETEEAKVKEEGGQVVTTKGEANEESETVKEEKALSPEVPKYGGVCNMLNSGDATNWDPFFYAYTGCSTLPWTHDFLMNGDWAKGPAGTGEGSLIYGFAGRLDLLTGWLAESWELPDDETIVWHIRKGVHWWNKSPVNGRELTAGDVVWTVNRAFSMPKCWWYSYTTVGRNPTSVKALDRYTVEMKFPPEIRGMMFLEISTAVEIFPPEPTELYGDMEDWTRICGTGPWMVTDYVKASTITLTRNPNYWQYDPIHPENQLPYMNGMKLFNIPDASTQEAAFRTGKLDWYRGTKEVLDSLLKEQPELQYKNRGGGTPFLVYFRVDKPPFSDLRVRQALNMAINREEMINEYFDGDAEILAFPYFDYPEFSTFYTPLDEQPAIVQELFTYNPEKARSLLTEAGYPNGFKTSVNCSNTANDVDYMSLIKAYFSSVGVDMDILAYERGAASNITRTRGYQAMVYYMSRPDIPYAMYCFRPEMIYNCSLWSDEKTEAAWNMICRNFGKDDATIARVLKELGPHILEQASMLWTPIPNNYAIWWPWFQNFYGTWDMGYRDQDGNWLYMWIDVNMKKSMGY